MKTLFAALALAAAVLLASSVFIVNERELAVLFQFGAVKKTDFAPGMHFKVPLLQNVRKFDRRVLTLDTDPERYITSEKKDLSVDFFVKWRIANVSRFYTATNGDEELAAQRIGPIVRQALGREISERTLQQVVGGERSNLMDEVEKSTSRGASELGVEIVDVRISRIELPNEVSGPVFDRMRSERKQVANQLRSEGAEAAEKIRADADRQRQVVLAEAERDAASIRGEGEAQASKIYADAFRADPGFFSFWRSMEAYRASFHGEDGVLVIDADSEFFDHFKGSQQ